jgi:hypothetical protein
MSSVELTQRLVSPGLGALSQSLNESTIIDSIVELSSAWKICFIFEIFEVEKGNFDEIKRGKNDLLGILSLIFGIGITFPFFIIDSRKNLPGSTNFFTKLPLSPHWCI